jgi:hypothetical protein
MRSLHRNTHPGPFVIRQVDVARVNADIREAPYGA